MPANLGTGVRRSWAAGLAWGLWVAVVLGWVGTAWLDGRLRRAGMPGAGPATRWAGCCWASGWG